MNTPSLILSLGDKEFPLTTSEVRIGRDSQNGVVVNDESISAFHSTITFSPHGLLLKDLDTTNGTFVNGRRIKETFIEAGDQIRFGNVGGRVMAQLPAEATTFCPSCGTGIAAEAKFCSSCGKAVVTESKNEGAKATFTWWPTSQLGASVLVALFVLIFSSWTYQPLGTVIMLTIVFGFATLLRYAYYRLKSSRKDHGKTQIIPTALWKRWPVRVGMILLLFEIPLLDYDDHSQSHKRSEYNSKMYAIEQEAKLHGENIDAWKNEDPFKSLAYLVRRDGNDHDFGQSTWQPINPQQQYFWLAGMRKVASEGQIAAHQGFVMFSIVFLFMVGYVLYDGLDERRRSKSKT